MYHTPEQLRRQLTQTPLARYLDLLDISTSDQVQIQHPDLNPLAQAWYDPTADKITLLADRIGPDTAAFTAWHEIGHRNIAVSGWRKWQLAWLKARQENTLVDNIACQIEQQRQTAGLALNRTAAAEEAAAELYAAHKTRQYGEIEKRYGITIPAAQRNTLGGFFARLQQKLTSIVRRALGKSAPDFADGQVHSLLQGMEKAEKTAAQQAGQPAKALRYNLYKGENARFAQVIDKIYSGKFTAQHKRLVDMGTTPEVLQMLGLPDVRVTIRETTIEKAFRNQLRPDEHGHNINPETLKQLPAQLNNPIAVMRPLEDSTNPDSLLMLTELMETEFLSDDKKERGIRPKEKPVIAALMLNQTAKGTEVINITTVHGRVYGNILEMLQKGTLYWHKEKGPQFLTVSESNFPPILQPTVQRIHSGANPTSHCKTEADLAQ